MGASRGTDFVRFFRVANERRRCKPIEEQWARARFARSTSDVRLILRP